MSLLHRIFIYYKRKPLKYIILFALFFLLGTISLGSLIVQTSIHLTTQQMNNQMPNVLTVISTSYDDEEEGYLRLTPEIVREIADLSYVYASDYTIDLSWGVSAGG